MLRLIPLLVCASLAPFANAQQYTIATVAGGAPPSTPAPANSTAIGQPRRVAVDSSGNIYFSASNSVFKMTAAGVLTLVAGNSRAGFSGDGGPAINAQLNTPQGIAVDKSGNVYIADSGNNRVRMVTAAGIMTTFAGNGSFSQGGGPGQYNDFGPATNALMHLPMGVAVDKSGNVFIADTGDNSIREVTPDGNINTVVGDSYPGFLGDGGNAQQAELNHPSDVAVDSSGNVYIADTANARIRQLTTAGVINTVAGNGTIGFSGDGAAATSAALLAPLGLAVDSSGNLFIVENGDSRIRKMDTKGIISTIAGNGTAGFSGDGSAALKAQMNSPTGIAVDSSGNLFIADFLNLRIRKMDSSGNISSVAGNGVLSFSGDGGPALSAQMNLPQGVAVDSAGNIYVADTTNNVVRKVAKNGTIVTVAGNASAGSNGDGSAATSAQLNGPEGLAVDKAGNLYIADTLNAKIRMVSTSGTISTFAGNGTPGFGGDNAAAASAQLNTPTSVAVDPAGNLYIADFSNNRIRKVSTGGTITTVAGNGIPGYAGDGGPAVNAQLTTPRGIAVDAAGSLYIADTGNSAIRMVTLGGLISTLAGNGLADFSGDGSPASKAQVVTPATIAVDSVGNIFFSDGGARVREIVYPSRIITTIAGTGTLGYSGDGGTGVLAQVNSPSGAAVDASGNLYIADTGNHAVRVLRFAGASLSIGSVVNGASNVTGSVAPGEVVVIYGSGLGPAALTQFQLGANGLVPTSVGGTSVLFNGIAAPVLYSSANQVAAVVPYNISGSTASVAVIYQGQVSPAVSLGVVAAAPGVFTFNSSGTGLAAAVNQNGSVNDASHP
ncbi:MAG TPA: hypothetical protein VGH38_22245, partial [Bryobacteraceae bacterium]